MAHHHQTRGGARLLSILITLTLLLSLLTGSAMAQTDATAPPSELTEASAVEAAPEEADATAELSATVDATDEEGEDAAIALNLDWVPPEYAQSLRQQVRGALPRFLVQQKLLTLEYWEWIALFGIILLGLVADFLTRAVTRLIAARFARRQGGEAESQTVTQAVRPVGLVAAAIIWITLLSVMRILGLPELAANILVTAAQIFAVLAGTWAAWRITDLVSEVLANRAAQTENRYDDVLIPLVRKAVKIFIVVFGVIYAAETVHIEIAPLLAGLGIGGLAFAFAAKDTIENFFGSVAVLLDRPFAVGDWVLIGDTEGTVEEIGFRSTRIRTFYNSQITVPNASLVRATVDNFGRRKYRRYRQHVDIEYSTPPDKILAFLEGIREMVRTHPYTRKDYFLVNLNEFGSTGLRVLIYVFHEVPDWSTELRERERLILDVIRLADQLGVRFAFPTQTLYFRRDEAGDHQPSPPPGPQTQASADQRGISAAQQLLANQPWREHRPGPVQFTEGPSELVAQDQQSVTGPPPEAEAEAEAETEGNGLGEAGEDFTEDTRAGG